MSFYPVSSSSEVSAVQFPGMDQGAVMVAVPVSALSWPVAEGASGDGRSAMVATGAEKITSGVLVVWCKVVAVAPAVVRRDGRVQADGRPCDHARLGALEEQLDEMAGPGTIDRIAAGIRPTGKIKGEKRRELSVAFALRATLLMTLLPQALTKFEGWETVVFGLILVLTMIFLPRGIVPTLADRLRREGG